MRHWNINRDIPLYITLAADYRFSTPQFTNDHIWEFKWDGNEPPAMSLQTTYGLRAHRMRLFPRFVYKGKGDGLSNPAAFYRPPAVTKFFPNYLSVYFTPFPGIDVQAEYWVPDSNAITGRFTFTNHSSLTESFRFELAGLLNPIDFGEGLTAEFYNGVNILKGSLDRIQPVCVMGPQAAASNSPFITLSQDIELFPGNYQILHWALASLNDHESSFMLAQDCLNKSWDAEISKIEILNASQSVDIYTGDTVWDEVLALSQKTAQELILWNEENPNIPPFVISRGPDQGFSLKGDGSDYPAAWNGPTAMDALYLFSILLPAGVDICEKILSAFLKSDPQGFINWKACHTDPYEKILCQPLLATLTLMVYEYKEDEAWLQNIFADLLNYFILWFSPQFDHDADFFPEWTHPQQTGLGESPVYDLWHTNSQFISVSSLEAPSLIAMLSRECASLIAICKIIGKESECAQLEGTLKKINENMLSCWNPQQSKFQYRDYLNHLSNKGEKIGDFYNGKNSLNLDFAYPSRLVIQIGQVLQETIPISITITGRTPQKNITEKITFKDFTRTINKNVFTTRNDYVKIYTLTVTGLDSENMVTLNTIDFTQDDISIYLPLWAAASLPQDISSKCVADLQKEYLKPFGIPVSTSNAPYVPLYWINLIGEGLIQSGNNALAVDLVSRIMDGLSQNLQKYGALFETFNAETGTPLGDKFKLNSLAPVGLFLKTLGLEKLTATSITINGINPYPWPVTIKYRNLTLTMHQEDATVTFANGQVVTVLGKGPHHIVI